MISEEKACCLFHTLQDAKGLEGEAQKQHNSGHDEEIQELLL